MPSSHLKLNVMLATGVGFDKAPSVSDSIWDSEIAVFG